YQGSIHRSRYGEILSHLLGSSLTSTTNSAAKASGVDKAKVKSILAAAAPLLLSVLGQQTNASSSNSNAVASLLSGVVSGNMGGLLSGLLGGGSSAQSGSASKPASSGKTGDLAGVAAGLLGSLLK
ncbi:MAG: DUF937 domain-containing protein, partial [Treponema sp.]|nr:DUF937 domain-containing protein [Treponema sp.]